LNAQVPSDNVLTNTMYLFSPHTDYPNCYWDRIDYDLDCPAFNFDTFCLGLPDIYPNTKIIWSTNTTFNLCNEYNYCVANSAGIVEFDLYFSGTYIMRFKDHVSGKYLGATEDNVGLCSTPYYLCSGTDWYIYEEVDASCDLLSNCFHKDTLISVAKGNEIV